MKPRLAEPLLAAVCLLGLACLAQAPGAPAGALHPLEVQLVGRDRGEPHAPMAGQQVTLKNPSDAVRTVRIEYLVQEDPALYSVPAPGPVWGSDHARGTRSWTEVSGKVVEEGSLTDARDWTNAALPWGSYQEAVQTIDLGRERTLTHLEYLAADANWAWKLDLSRSQDGKRFEPVPGLQEIDLHAKWGRQALPVPQPFTARYLRLRHHQGGRTVNQFSMPAAFSVYDGLADEKWELPVVGTAVARGSLSQAVPPSGTATVRLPGDRPLAPGAYLVAVRVRDGEQTQILYRHYLVMPPAITPEARSRFGLNVANVQLAPLHRRLGVGWVRFENLKWPMVSPAPNTYRFDGVPPWNVKHDEIMRTYRAQGLSILPFLFLTPEYATSAPAGVEKNRASYPPRDNAQLADFVFQTVARYGARKHPPEALKTTDRKSGLDQIHIWEVWNEPNLTDPNWGPWVGTAAQYHSLFRAAAEAVKRADPAARVTNGGFAGIDVETLNTLLAPYPDGKKPIDFVDVLNVHFYSGRAAPEVAVNDPNANRTGGGTRARTYEDDLRRLIAWRDRRRPGIPIWMSETGYDSAGPFGTDERTQAARLPRVVLMALAAGVEKVLVYREAGSTPTMHAASGVVREDGTLKPSWFTYATLIRELEGVQTGALRLPYPDPNVRLYAWTRGAETVLTAWAIEGTADLKLRLGPSTVTDAFGRRRRVDVASKLPLSVFPTYVREVGYPDAVRTLVERARQQEAARKKELARLAKLRAYLFDFGNRERVGTLELGETRSFTPVLGADVYDERRGYGFYPGPGGPDMDAPWISDPLERDGTRMDPQHAFRLRVPPGRYELRARLSPRSTGALTLKGAPGGERAFPLAPNGPLVTAEIEVGTEPLTLSNTAYADVLWLALVERAKP